MILSSPVESEYGRNIKEFLGVILSPAGPLKAVPSLTKWYLVNEPTSHDVDLRAASSLICRLLSQYLDNPSSSLMSWYLDNLAVYR